MSDLIVLVIVGLIVGCAAGYIYKAKKRGSKCIGCPDGGSCASAGKGGCGCGCGCGAPEE